MKRLARFAGKLALAILLLIVLLPPAGRLAGWSLYAIGWWFESTGFYLR